jgi:hypothetical protein
MARDDSSILTFEFLVSNQQVSWEKYLEEYHFSYFFKLVL